MQFILVCLNWILKILATKSFYFFDSTWTIGDDEKRDNGSHLMSSHKCPLVTRLLYCSINPKEFYKYIFFKNIVPSTICICSINPKWNYWASIFLLRDFYRYSSFNAMCICIWVWTVRVIKNGFDSNINSSISLLYATKQISFWKYYICRALRSEETFFWRYQDLDSNALLNIPFKICNTKFIPYLRGNVCKHIFLQNIFISSSHLLWQFDSICFLCYKLLIEIFEDNGARSQSRQLTLQA